MLAVNIVVNILVLFAQTFDSLEFLEPVLGVLEALTISFFIRMETGMGVSPL